MLQTIDGRKVYVAEFDEIPELPITWDTPEEEPYARCLDNAIRTQVITKPGKYGIYVTVGADEKLTYHIYTIKE